MTRQPMFQAKKESQPLKTSSLFRRQAAQAPAAEQEPAFPPIHLGQDHSAIPFKPVHPVPALGPSSISCPFTPERCPFGGACHACPPKMQAKLKIGQPGDKYEQEADRVAEQVMRMPKPQVQRTCSAPGCKDEDEKKLLQTKPANAGEAGAQVDHPLIQNVLSSPGQPLDAGTRSFMEPRFRQDFSGVRVHVGGQAAESARAVNARAYTVGRDVVFGEGQYAPGSDEGKRLVAHELAHVGQQGKSASIVPHDDFEELQHTSNIGASIQRMQGTGIYEALDDEVLDGDSPSGALSDVDSESEKNEPEVNVFNTSTEIIQFKKKQGKTQNAPRTITQVNVDLSGQTLTITWSDGTTSKPVVISSGKGLPDTKDDPCKAPNVKDSNCTPTGNFTVGKKGDASYQNQKGDRMSWYVEFESKRAIGIHNSQAVTGQPASHGCVRVDNATAMLINKNITKNTTVNVSGKAPTKKWTKTKPQPKKKKS